MSEHDKPTRRNKRGYMPRTNAVCITIYQPQGENVHPDIIQACTEAIEQIAHDHNLLIGVATT